MSVGEFKAWLDGYLENNVDTPAKKVKRIQEKVGEIQETVPYIPYTPYIPWYPTQPIWITTPTWTYDGTSTTNHIDVTDFTFINSDSTGMIASNV